MEDKKIKKLVTQCKPKQVDWNLNGQESDQLRTYGFLVLKHGEESENTSKVDQSK
jgi:hypothetical protein